MGDSSPVVQTQTLYCANHPTVETLLRCSKCDRPICQRCGIRTPVGIRCRECSRMRRSPIYSLGALHYLVAAAVALPASFVAGLVMQQIGLLFAFFLGAAVGGLIAEIVYRATGGKRGRGLAWLVSGCILAGALASGAMGLLFLPGVTLGVLANPQALAALVMRLNLVYVVLAMGAALARLS